jgi:endonuclease III
MPDENWMLIMQQPEIKNNNPRAKNKPRSSLFAKKYDWEFTDEDWERAHIIHEAEIIDPLTPKSAFNALAYSILSQRETYEKQVKMYDKLRLIGMLDPQSMLAEQERFGKILRVHGASLFKDKKKRLLSLAEFWTKDNNVYPIKMIADVTGTQEYMDELRDELIQVHGIGLKTASLAFIKYGYTGCASLDVWNIRYAHSEGILEKVGLDKKVVESRLEIPKQFYKKVEQEMNKIAQGYGVNLACLDACIWGKYAKWSEESRDRYINNGHRCNLFDFSDEI